MSAASTTDEPTRAWRQTAVITAVAIAVFLVVRWLPLAGGSLHYTDFGAGQRGFLEFCEPGSPQFAPVDRVHSPVLLTLRTDAPLRTGVPARVTAQLATASGKPVTADDLLVVHTRKLHLLIIDATLADYHHAHPEPGETAGTFVFAFTPRRAGRYRVFADFMPRATGRALYAGASLDVAGAEITTGVDLHDQFAATVDGVTFKIAADRRPLRLNETSTLVLTIARESGAPLELEDVMDAPAHLVAFDERCSGFAHLHPAPSSPEILSQTGAGHRLAFTINLPDPGRYRLWAQVRIDGHEIFAPFDLSAAP